MMLAKIKKLYPNAKIPQKAHDSDAAFDLYAYFDESATEGDVEGILPGQTCKVGTGVSITPPPGYFGAIFARSGLSVKQGLRLANSVAVMDPGYTGEYIVALHNDSEDTQVIGHGDRIAQLMFLPVADVQFEEVDELNDSDRLSGGFGSSGTK